MREVESYSAVSNFKTCPRYYQLSRLVQLDVGPREELIGTLFHDAWHEYNATGQRSGSNPHVKAMMSAYPNEPVKGLPEWPLTLDGVKIVPDMVVRTGPMEGYIKEMKTGKGLDWAKVMESYRISGQMQLYQAILTMLGIKITHCELEYVRVPGRKRKSGEDDEHYFLRLADECLQNPHYYQKWHIKFSRQEIAEALLDMRATMNAMELCLGQRYWPRYTSNCNWMYGKECKYKGACGT